MFSFKICINENYSNFNTFSEGIAHNAFMSYICCYLWKQLLTALVTVTCLMGIGNMKVAV